MFRFIGTLYFSGHLFIPSLKSFLHRLSSSSLHSAEPHAPVLCSQKFDVISSALRLASVSNLVAELASPIYSAISCAARRADSASAVCSTHFPPRSRVSLSSIRNILWKCHRHRDGAGWNRLLCSWLRRASSCGLLCGPWSSCCTPANMVILEYCPNCANFGGMGHIGPLSLWWRIWWQI